MVSGLAQADSSPQPVSTIAHVAVPAVGHVPTLAPRLDRRPHPRDARTGFVQFWADLMPAGRMALVGLGACAIGVMVFATSLSSGVTQYVVDARGQRIQADVLAMSPSLPALAGRSSLRADEIEALDAAIQTSLPDGIRVKLWALDGTILYSDARTLIGRTYPDAVPSLNTASSTGLMSLVTEGAMPDNEFEAGHDRMVEHYVAIYDSSGAPAAVLESYDNIGFVDAAVEQIGSVTRTSLAVALSLLFLCVAIVLVATGRSTSRQRVLASARAREFTILSTAADAVATSLDPKRLFAALQARVATDLELDRLDIVRPERASPTAFCVPLRDGTMLAAERSQPLSEEEARILQAAGHGLDAALANSALFTEVREAAAERQVLIRNVAVAHEEERKRLVRELHDSLASDLIRTLYAVRRADAINAERSPEMSSSIKAIERMVEDSEVRLRAFMGAIRPAALDISDLTAATRDVVARFRSETGMPARVYVGGQPDRLRASAQVVLVRALEEALLNVAKHAEASRVRVSLTVRHGCVHLAISDDGTGWPEGSEARGDGRGLGLSYLRERVTDQGGTVDLSNGPRGGARLEVRIPIEGATS